MPIFEKIGGCEAYGRNAINAVSESTIFITSAKPLFNGAKKLLSNIYNESLPEKLILDFCGSHPLMRSFAVLRLYRCLFMMVSTPRRNGY